MLSQLPLSSSKSLTVRPRRYAVAAPSKRKFPSFVHLLSMSTLNRVRMNYRKAPIMTPRGRPRPSPARARPPTSPTRSRRSPTRSQTRRSASLNTPSKPISRPGPAPRSSALITSNRRPGSSAPSNPGSCTKSSSRCSTRKPHPRRTRRSARRPPRRARTSWR